jgi:SAM-dependent methyltransferase
MSAANEFTRYSCGCANATDPASGVLRSVVKCDHHRSRQRDPATLDEAYYAELGIIRDGKLLPTAHVAELAEALGDFPDAPSGSYALEVGCGVSPYVFAITVAGYHYVGVEPSKWAADWVWRTYGVRVVNEAIESAHPLIPVYSLILAAHVLEHLGDAPGAVAKLAAMLRPGGELWVIVPDDSDPTNPDHLFFFTEATLWSCLEAAGLSVERMAVRRRVPHERFIYARAVKK